MTQGPDLPRVGSLPADFFETEEEEPISLFAVASLFLRHIRLILGLPALAFLVVFISAQFGTQPYTAMSKFMPANTDPIGGQGSGGGLMAQLGQLVNGPSGASPRFYAGLLTSGPLARSAAQDTYEITVEGEVRRGTVAELYGQQPANPELNVRQSRDIIVRSISAIPETGTGFVVLRVTSEYPELAVAINQRLLELVNEFNIEQRQTQAAKEREFIEGRMAQAKAELESAENALQRFMEANQQYEQSPRLRFEASRLQRQVDFRQSQYTMLAQAYEQARITEVRNTPATAVVEWPADNVRRDRRQSPLFSGFLASVVALLVAIGLVLALAYLNRHSEQHSEDYDEFRDLARSALPPRASTWLDARRRRRQGGGADRGGRGDRGDRGDGPRRLGADPGPDATPPELERVGEG